MLTWPSNTNLVELTGFSPTCLLQTNTGRRWGRKILFQTSLFCQGAKTAWAIYLAPEIAHPAPQAVPYP